MGQVIHIRQMRKNGGDMTYWLEDHRRRNYLGDLGLGTIILLKQTLQKYSMKMWTKFNWLSTRPKNGLM